MKKIYSILTVLIAFNAAAFAGCDPCCDTAEENQEVVNIDDDEEVNS